MKRFFLSLKMERVWQREYTNHAEARVDIADYIAGFYKPVRLHSKLGNLPPNVYEQQIAAKQPIGVSEKLDHFRFGGPPKFGRSPELVWARITPHSDYKDSPTVANIDYFNSACCLRPNKSS